MLWNQPIDVFIVFARNNSHGGGSTLFFRHGLTCRFDPSFSSSNYHIYAILRDLFSGMTYATWETAWRPKKIPKSVKFCIMCDAANSSWTTATQTGECGDFTIWFISDSPPKPKASRLVNIVSLFTFSRLLITKRSRRLIMISIFTIKIFCFLLSVSSSTCAGGAACNAFTCCEKFYEPDAKI